MAKAVTAHPEEFLDLHLHGYSAREACERLGICVTNVAAWKKADDLFRKRYELQKVDPERAKNRKRMLVEISLEDPWNAFCEHLDRHHMWVEAADFARLSVMDIKLALDPESTLYNEEFAERITEIKLRRSLRMADQADEASRAGSESMTKYLMERDENLGGKFSKARDDGATGQPIITVEAIEGIFRLMAEFNKRPMKELEA